MNQIKYMIGIDAGGTSSKGIAILEDGNVLCKSISGGGSLAVLDEDTIWRHIESVIDDIINQVDSNIYVLDFIQMGLSAFSIIDDVRKKEEYFMTKYKVEVSIKSDTLIALYSVLKDKFTNGVVAVSGTGVAVYGKHNDDFCLIGGWGHIIRELGSAYSLVLHLALKIIDNMETNTPLSEFEASFLEYLKSKNIVDLKHLFYGYSKSEIAEMAIYIKEQSSKYSDAYNLLFDEGKMLGMQIVKAVKKIKLEDSFIIGLRGGFVQKSADVIVEGIKEILKKHSLDKYLVIDSEEPIYGTYYLYKKIRGI